jgi:hypothetical protein
MPDEEIAQFFAPSSDGDSQQTYKAILDGLESLQTSEIRARNGAKELPPVPSLIIDGIPGIPLERSLRNPDVFYQGEDIVYDTVLRYNGGYVTSENYNVYATVKSSPRAQTPVWEGFLDNGVYEDNTRPGYFELWIPSAVTANFLAGSYYLHVLLKEKLGRGAGRFDRQYVVLQTYFNIDYSNFSPAPESRQPGAAQELRNAQTSTWPNSPDTIGRPVMSDVINEMLGTQ